MTELNRATARERNRLLNNELLPSNDDTKADYKSIKTETGVEVTPWTELCSSLCSSFETVGKSNVTSNLKLTSKNFTRIKSIQLETLQ